MTDRSIPRSVVFTQIVFVKDILPFVTDTTGEVLRLRLINHTFKDAIEHGYAASLWNGVAERVRRADSADARLWRTSLRKGLLLGIIELFLVSGGLDPNTTPCGATFSPLATAALHGSAAAVQLLLKHGADVERSASKTAPSAVAQMRLWLARKEAREQRSKRREARKARRKEADDKKKDKKRDDDSKKEKSSRIKNKKPASPSAADPRRNKDVNDDDDDDSDLTDSSNNSGGIFDYGDSEDDRAEEEAEKEPPIPLDEYEIAVSQVSPLFLAASRGNFEVCQMLVKEGGADVLAADPDGTTALHLAAERGDLRTARALLEKPDEEAVRRRKRKVNELGARVIAIVDSGKEAQQQQQQHHHHQSMAGLEKSNETVPAAAAAAAKEDDDNAKEHARRLRIVSVCNKRGQTPLHRACAGGNLLLVKELLQISLKDRSKSAPTPRELVVDAVDEFNNSALNSAVLRNHVNIVEYLVDECQSAERKIWTSSPANTPYPFRDPDAISKHPTALHCACVANSKDLVSFIVHRRFVDINARCAPHLATPLMVCAQHGSHVAAAALLAPQAIDTEIDLFMVDSDGYSALALAVRSLDLEMVKLLLGVSVAGSRSKLVMERHERVRAWQNHRFSSLAALERSREVVAKPPPWTLADAEKSRKELVAALGGTLASATATPRIPPRRGPTVAARFEIMRRKFEEQESRVRQEIVKEAHLPATTTVSPQQSGAAGMPLMYFGELVKFRNSATYKRKTPEQRKQHEDSLFALLQQQCAALEDEHASTARSRAKARRRVQDAAAKVLDELEAEALALVRRQHLRFKNNDLMEDDPEENDADEVRQGAQKAPTTSSSPSPLKGTSPSISRSNSTADSCSLQ